MPHAGRTWREKSTRSSVCDEDDWPAGASDIGLARQTSSLAVPWGSCGRRSRLGSRSCTSWAWQDGRAQRSLRLTYKHDEDSPGELQRHQYYPFGDPTTNGPPASSNDRGYLNKTHDPSGDIRLDQRNYTPHFNQLTAPDPILDVGNPVSFNPYSYAANNPIAASDPTGLICTADPEIPCGPSGIPPADPSGDADPTVVGVQIPDQEPVVMTLGAFQKYMIAELNAEIAYQATVLAIMEASSVVGSLSAR